MNIKRILLILVLLGLVVGGSFAYMVYSAFFTPNTSFEDKEVFVFIPSDASFSDVKKNLGPLLKDVVAFESAAKRKGYTENIRAGKYRLVKGMNNNELINNLRVGNVPVKVAFNNQETLADLAGRISDQIEADSISLLNAFRDTDFLSENKMDLDTSLALYVPNSYEFFWNTDAVEFRTRMLTEYNRFWTDARKTKAKALGLTQNEVVTLASIVHKETAKIDERPKVAGLYLNRLRTGMLLQADPTVIYAIKKETGNFDTIIKRVLYKDLEIESPYNTYKNAGLPPGPITMPDISAVDGVLNPEKHNYFYMVANVENFGYHMFAKDLAQHGRNKVQYVRWINAQKIKR